ncbi:hypothetical protein [Nocardia fusca]|uniref:hypothetical protein n=1 Tax=Nocardia fusca TaxID=941183 RepID=UPI0012F4B49E|nr:hypothetical protein [Nocardia fusca]
MGESFHIDPDAARLLTDELRSIAESAGRTARALQDALTAAGMTEAAASWGDDEMGQAFAEYYLPGAEEGVSALESSAGALHELGSILDQSISAFETVDSDGGRRLRADAARLQSPHPESGALRSADRIPVVGEVPAARTPALAGVPDSGPGAPVPAGTAPGTGDPVGSSTSEPGTPTAGAANDPSTGTPAQPEAGHPYEGDSPTGPSAPARPANDPARPETPPAQTGRGAAPSAPGDRGTARSPWSGPAPTVQPIAEGRGAPAAATPRVSAPPQQGGPPRDVPPTPQRGVSADTPPNQPGGTPRTNPPGRRDDRRQEQRPAAAIPKSPKARHEPVQPPPTVTDPAAMRVIEELAARHGLRISGFDTAGLDEPAAREIAAAVDQVLEQHRTIDLRVLEIADSADGLPARLERAAISDADQLELRAAHIVLDRAAATDPGLRAAAIERAIGGRRPAPGAMDRSLYAMVVRELGRALSAAGDHAAHRLAQRTLIAEYLRIAGPEHAGDPLGRIVSGYRHWRDRLSGCSPTTRFDPGAALVEAFTEVELHSDRASTPATALHRLLVDTAKQRT